MYCINPNSSKKIFLIPLAIFLLSQIHLINAELLINEIMYDPPDDNEWIELYNSYPFPVDLSSWYLTDNKEKDQLMCCSFNPSCSLIIPSQGYVIIADQDTTLYNASSYNFLLSSIMLICVNDNTIGNGLGNTGDTLNLSNQTAQTIVTYTSSQGGNKNNKTLERRSDGSWGESIINFGTPGRKNSIYNLISEYQSLQITEILPDPFNSDEAKKPGGEWIELFNAGQNTIDLKSLFFKDAKNSSKLMISDTTINDPSGTLLCSHCYKTIYRNGDSDFSLNNDYDEVSLWYQNTLLDSMSYSGSTEGMSWSKVNDIWIETKPTPDKENEQSNSCDWELNIQTPSSIFEESPSFTLEANRLTGFAQNISVKGTITNLKGTILTSYAPWTQKAVTTKSSTTYSPNLAPGTYLISFYYNNLSCEDTNLKNNNVSTLIAIDSPPIQNTSLVHSLTLKQDNPFQWGDDFIISLSLFKGDTAKQRVDLWVEKDSKKVSSTISLNLLTKFQNYSLSLPLSLNQNCNQKITDGLAKIIVEGLDMHAEKEIIIENINPNNCESSSSSSTSSSTTSSSESSNRKKRSPTFQIVETPATIVAGDALRVKIQIENPSGNHEFHISNALYNKRKCLTCKENDTLSSSSSKISLKEGEIKVVDSLLLIPKTIQQGEYQLKVKIIKDNQKTVHQLETPIYIKDQPLTLSTAQEINSLKSTSISESPLQYLTSSKARHQDEQITGFVVYESNAQKTKKTIPYFIIITLALLSLVLVLRNGKKKISA